MTGPPRERRSRPAEYGPAAVEQVTTTITDGPTVPDPCDLADHLDRESMYAKGFTDGFEAGVDVGAGKVILGLEHALGGLPDLLGTDLLDVAGERFAARYAAERAAQRTDPTELCPAGQVNPQHRCATCARVAAREANRRAWGTGDYPPAAARALVLLGQLARTS